MKPILSRRAVGLLSALVAAVVLLTPIAAASGSGYSLSYTKSAGGTTNANVDLISLTTSPTATQVTVTFQVSGSLVLNSGSYAYYIFFGGGAQTNATAYAWFSNSTANGTWFSVSGMSYGYGELPFTLGNGGSSLTFAINQSAVGPASTFTANAFAAQGSRNSGTYSYLGTNYVGGAMCSGTTCTSTGTSTASTTSGWVWIGLGLGVVLVVIILVVVVLVVLPKRRTPPP
ncbi:MAG: hypothetical protein L3J91_00890, partial [Thermoplasmata archaeon]|nr:hypothetical protein [Thermoplasmata archaeon]